MNVVRSLPLGTAWHAHDAANRRTSSVVSSAGTTTLAYDYEGRVVSISGPGVSDAFTYNGLDKRVGKVEASGAKSFRHDGAGETAGFQVLGTATVSLSMVDGGLADDDAARQAA